MFAAVLAVVLLFGFWPGAEINQNCGRIGCGMTFQEVTQIIKLPPGDYRILPDASKFDMIFAFFGRQLSGPGTHSWISDFGRIDIQLGADGRVHSVDIGQFKKW
jgi:hypothetical protein